MSDPELVAEIAARIRRAVNAKTVDIRPCVCGGQVRADRWAPTHGVASHNRSKLHRLWREMSTTDPR